MASPFAYPGIPCRTVTRLFNSAKSGGDYLLSGVKQHWFQDSLEIIIPVRDSANHVNESKEKILTTLQKLKDYMKRAGRFYKCRIGLSSLLDTQFLDKLEYSGGHIYGISLHTQLDVSDVIALYNGHLVMHVSKDRYEELGLEGKPSTFSGFGNKNRRNAQRYVIDIDLRSIGDSSNDSKHKKTLERLKWCFNNTFTDEFDFLFTSASPCALGFMCDDTSSWIKLTAIFYYPDQWFRVNFSELFRNATCYIPSFEICVREDIMIPTEILPSEKESETPAKKKRRLDKSGTISELSNEPLYNGSYVKRMPEIIEWASLVGLNSPRIQKNDTEVTDPFISTYCLSEPHTSGSCYHVSVQGFFGNYTIYEVIKGLREINASVHADITPFTVLLNHGMMNSPITWGNNEHVAGGYFGYMVLLQPGELDIGKPPDNTIEGEKGDDVHSDKQITGVLVKMFDKVK
ncbi:ribonuclease P 40kDa subunit-domain-containing protein [Paraphysoderma sedebokerense]|nr:ribonuclease P 40kDa subunit-domain-containing protein [Paraphysoderma sedebokerense]